MVRILVVDNHDSFVFTLVGYLRELGAEVDVVEADELHAEPDLAGYDGVLVSPGPRSPEEAEGSLAAVRACVRARLPLLGVCLGHQVIQLAFGGEVVTAPEPRHGVVSEVSHDGSGVFRGLPDPFRAARYHSLVAGSVPDPLLVTARTPEGVVMGIRHRELPIEGVQFHPESVLTEGGYLLLGTWLEGLGLAGARERARALRP